MEAVGILPYKSDVPASGLRVGVGVTVKAAMQARVIGSDIPRRGTTAILARGCFLEVPHGDKSFR
jgi:hypothetical protein